MAKLETRTVKTDRGACRRARIAGALLGLSMLPPALVAGPAAEAPTGCAVLLQTGERNQIPPRFLRSLALGSRVQRGLAGVFGDDPAFEAEQRAAPLLSDGRIGGVTRGWLERLCVDYPVHPADGGLPAAVMEAALHYGEITAERADWRATITSPEFEAWVQAAADDGPGNRRALRRAGAAPVVLGLLAEFAASGSPPAKPAAAAAGASCASLERGVRPFDPQLDPGSPAIGSKLQQGLEAVFAGNPEYQRERGQSKSLSDGKVGAHTRKWLARFCREFPPSGPPQAVADGVVRSVIHYAGVAAVHPDWRQLLTDPGFATWITQTESSNRRLRLSGPAPVINALLDEYPREHEPHAADRRTPTCPSPPPPGVPIYYELTEQDWQRLRVREAFHAQLEGLLDQRFESPQALLEALGPAADLLARKCVSNRFFETVGAALRKPIVAYRLTAASIDRLRDRLTSPERLTRPEELRFVAALLSALAQLQDQPFDSQDALARVVRFEARLALAGDDPASPDAAAETLRRKQDEDAPAAAPGAPKIDDGTAAAAEPAPADSSAAASAQESDAQRPAAEQEPAIDLLVGEVVAAAERQTWPYVITAGAVDALRGDRLFVAFPEEDLLRLRPLLGVAYPNDGLYASAVRNLLGPDAALEELQAIVVGARKQGDASRPLKIAAAPACGCSRRWDKVGKNEFVVYGFYPSWLAAPGAVRAASAGDDGTPASAAADTPIAQPDGLDLDFGIFSRIGYYALELNEEGRIVDRRQWSTAGGAGAFIRLARRHLSRADLVIDLPHWQSWGEAQRAQAVEEIGALFDPASPDLPDGLVPDGVTLYLPGYLQSPDAKHRSIVALVTQLHAKLHPAAGAGEGRLARLLSTVAGREPAQPPRLNLMIDANELDLAPAPADRGQRRLLGNLKFLGSLGEILVGDAPKVDLVLVALGQPVTDVKKRLRLAVENEFQGEDRIGVLRRIVPVIPPNGHLEQERAAGDAKWGSAGDPYRQLYHDLFYFRDNFRGVGLWPAVPVAAGEEDPAQFAALKRRLIGVFSQSGEEGAGRLVESLLGQDPCLFICPNRGYLKIVFFVFAGVLTLIAAAAYWSCRLRSLVARNVPLTLVLVALLILMFVAFITCVPTWHDRQTGILTGLLVLIIGVWIFYYIRKVKQGPLP